MLRHGLRKFTVPRTSITKANTIIYRASEHDCKHCALKAQCCPNTPMRKITRQVNELARDVARKLAKTPAYARSRRQRKKVEVLFAHLKRILRLRRLRLRGPRGAHDEFLVAATAQNPRRMAMWLMPKELPGACRRPTHRCRGSAPVTGSGRPAGRSAPQGFGRRQMSNTPLVRWALAFPSGSAMRPSATMGLFQWPSPASSSASSRPLVASYTYNPP